MNTFVVRMADGTTYTIHGGRASVRSGVLRFTKSARSFSLAQVAWWYTKPDDAS